MPNQEDDDTSQEEDVLLEVPPSRDEHSSTYYESGGGCQPNKSAQQDQRLKGPLCAWDKFVQNHQARVLCEHSFVHHEAAIMIQCLLRGVRVRAAGRDSPIGKARSTKRAIVSSNGSVTGSAVSTFSQGLCSSAPAPIEPPITIGSKLDCSKQGCSKLDCSKQKHSRNLLCTPPSVAEPIRC